MKTMAGQQGLLTQEEPLMGLLCGDHRGTRDQVNLLVLDQYDWEIVGLER